MMSADVCMAAFHERRGPNVLKRQPGMDSLVRSARPMTLDMFDRDLPEWSINSQGSLQAYPLSRAFSAQRQHV